MCSACIKYIVYLSRSVEVCIQVRCSAGERRSLLDGESELFL